MRGCTARGGVLAAQVFVHQLGARLSQAPFDQNLFANVSKFVGDGSGWNIAPKDVTSVATRGLVTGNVGKVSAVVPTDTPHSDSVNGLSVDYRSGVRIDQFQCAFIQG